jgi:hypothetical protein
MGEKVMQLVNRLSRLFSGRTRPSRPAAARKAQLRVEQLDGRLLPAITFLTIGNSLYAYNAYDHTATNNGLRWINTAPLNMDEGSDGILFATNGYGTLRYNYWQNTWTQLTGAQAIALSAAEDNTLFASYGNGTWEFDRNGAYWWVDARIATKLAAVGYNYFYGSNGSQGTWQYNNGRIVQIDSGAAFILEANRYGLLTGSWSDGTWQYKNGWTLISYEPARDIAVVSSAPNTFYVSWSYGTFSYVNNSGGTGGFGFRFEGLVASQLGADSTGLVGSWSDGTWRYDGGWMWIAPPNQVTMIA